MAVKFADMDGGSPQLMAQFVGTIVDICKNHVADSRIWVRLNCNV